MKHLKILWTIALALITLMLIQSFLRYRSIRTSTTSFVPMSLTLTPPGYALGHPEIQCPAVPLTYSSEVPDLSIGKELLPK